MDSIGNNEFNEYNAGVIFDSPDLTCLLGCFVPTRDMTSKIYNALGDKNNCTECYNQ